MSDVERTPLPRDRRPETGARSVTETPLPRSRRSGTPETRILRAGGPSEAEKIVATGAAEKDRALDQHLVGLISNLEFCRAQLTEAGSRPEPELVLEVAGTMVKQLSEGAERRLAPLVNRPDLDAALAKVRAFHDAARALSEELGTGSVLKSISRWFRKEAGSEGQRQQKLRAVTGALVEVLDSFFALYQTGFQLPASAEAWVQTHTVFLNDLIESLDRVHC